MLYIPNSYYISLIKTINASEILEKKLSIIHCMITYRMLVFFVIVIIVFIENL